MEKILLSFLLIFFVASMGEARPVWEENCPQGLQDATYKEIRPYWPESTKSTQEIYNYWAMRRAEFQDALAVCDFMSGEFQNTCYEKLRLKQSIDNELYQMKLENKKISSQIWKDTNKITNPVMFNIFSK
jgi:hypothetical protein